MTTIHGIDIAYFNAVDLDTVARTCAFVLHKCSQGVNITDPAFAHRRSVLSARGVVMGGYHFLESRVIRVGRGPKRVDRGPAYDGAAQARYYIAAMKRANGGTLDGLICIVDIEHLNWSKDHPNSQRWAPGKSTHSIVKKVDAVNFIREFRRLAPGQPLWIYTTSSIWGSFGNPKLSSIASSLYIWPANWTCSTSGTAPTCGHMRKTGMSDHIPNSYWKSKPFGGASPVCRQWSNAVSAPGNWSHRCDADTFNGTVTDMQRYTHVNTAPPAPGDDSHGDPGDPPPVTPPVDDPYAEPWIDPATGTLTTQGQVAAAGIGGVATGGSIVGGVAIVIGAVALGAWQLSKSRKSIFAWQSEDQ